MLRCLKTALARMIPFCRKPFHPRGVPMKISAIEISDRLHEAACELAVVEMAITGGLARGFDIEGNTATGILLLLERQIEQIEALRRAVYWPKRR